MPDPKMRTIFFLPLISGFKNDPDDKGEKHREDCAIRSVILKEGLHHQWAGFPKSRCAC